MVNTQGLASLTLSFKVTSVREETLTGLTLQLNIFSLVISYVSSRLFFVFQNDFCCTVLLLWPQGKVRIMFVFISSP